MLYRLSKPTQAELLLQPESGMGYQLILANTKGGYQRKEYYLILNTELAIPIDRISNRITLERIMRESTYTNKNIQSISLTDIALDDKKSPLPLVNEFLFSKKQAARKNHPEPANGIERFIRLSAYNNDFRIDRANKRLLPGSYATTEIDYLLCRKNNDDPVERYALPNDYKIKYGFIIQPKSGDSLQRGIVEPANEKQGGGAEVYFEKGTSIGTFIQDFPYE